MPEKNPYEPPHSRQPAPASQPPPKETASIVDAIIPTNPLTAISCWCGIFSVLFCFLGVVLGPLAVITGILGLKHWKVQETAYGRTTSQLRAWIGIVAGSLGTIIGTLAIAALFFNR